MIVNNTNYFTKYQKYKTKYIQATTIDKVVHIGGYSEFEVSATMRSLRNLDLEYNKYCKDKIHVVEHIRNRKEIELKEAIKSYFAMLTIYERDTNTSNPRFEFTPTNPEHNIEKLMQRPSSRQQPISPQQSRPRLEKPSRLLPQQQPSRSLSSMYQQMTEELVKGRTPVDELIFKYSTLREESKVIDGYISIDKSVINLLNMENIGVKYYINTDKGYSLISLDNISDIDNQLKKNPVYANYIDLQRKLIESRDSQSSQLFHQQPLRQTFQQQLKQQQSHSQSSSYQRLPEESLKKISQVENLILKYSELRRKSTEEIDEYINIDKSDINLLNIEKIKLIYYIKDNGSYSSVIDARQINKPVYVKYNDLQDKLIASR